jgi:hypothetical protein
MASVTTAPAPARIAWHWPRFWYGLVLALPAAVVALADTQLGLGMAVGMLPAAAIGLPPLRRRRSLSFAVSVVAALSLALGALLGLSATTAVVGLFVLGLASSLAAARLRGGRLAMLLAVPLVGLGLSFDVPSALAGAGMIVLGGLYAWLVSLLWPERTPPPRDPDARAPTPHSQALSYGVLLGLAGATAALVAYAFDLDHKGWGCGAALLVMRPDTEPLVTRSLGRAVSVLLGAVLGSVLVASTGSSWALSAGILAAVSAQAGTTGSRWYVAPVFTTFVVFLLLLWDHPTDTTWRFVQRNLETLAGVTIALFYGAVVPLVIRRLRPGPPAPENLAAAR